METVNVTLGTNSIAIDIAGYYRVDFFLSIQSTTGNFDLTVYVGIDGAPSESSLIIATILTADFEFITLSSIVALTEGNVLTLELASGAGGGVLFGPATNANLSVIRLGT
ncbi:MAG: hypothetical protein ACOYJC_10920 [Christensenellales bacterium]